MPSSLFRNTQPRVQAPKNNSLLGKIATVWNLLRGRKPEDVIKSLIASGQMSEAQFQELKKEAESIVQTLR